MTSLNSGGWEFRENEIAYIFMYIYMFFTYVERFNNNNNVNYFISLVLNTKTCINNNLNTFFFF